jgi:hypothetical protein
MFYPEASYWKEIVNNKIEFIMTNNTWKLVDLLKKKQTLCHKWIFKRNIKANEIINKYIAKLVVKGFNKQKVWSILTYNHLYQE